MSTVTDIIPVSTHYDLEKVKTIILSTAHQIMIDIVKGLIQEKVLTNNIDFKALAERQTLPDLKDSLNTTDAKTNRVYQKLYAVAKEHIQQHSLPVWTTFTKINLAMEDETAGDKFLGSYVWRATPGLIATLDSEQPGATDAFIIWE